MIDSALFIQFKVVLLQFMMNTKYAFGWFIEHASLVVTQELSKYQPMFCFGINLF